MNTTEKGRPLTWRPEPGDKEYRIRFKHHRPLVPSALLDKKSRPILREEFFKVDRAHNSTHLSARRAKAITVCAVIVSRVGVKDDLEPRALAEAHAVCSASDTFDREFARQAALARVLWQLGADISRPMLGAYMASASRPLCDLSHVKLDENGVRFNNLRELVDFQRTRDIKTANVRKAVPVGE